MGYTNDVEMVRVDIFKESGKWYTTEAVKWIGWEGKNLIHDAFRKSLEFHFKNRRNCVLDGFRGMWAVCLEPYHEHSHPIMMQI